MGEEGVLSTSSWRLGWNPSEHCLYSDPASRPWTVVQVPGLSPHVPLPLQPQDVAETRDSDRTLPHQSPPSPKSQARAPPEGPQVTLNGRSLPSTPPAISHFHAFVHAVPPAQITLPSPCSTGQFRVSLWGLTPVSSAPRSPHPSVPSVLPHLSESSILASAASDCKAAWVLRLRSTANSRAVPAYSQRPEVPSLLNCCLFPQQERGRCSLTPWTGGEVWKTNSFIHSLTHPCNLNMCSEGRGGVPDPATLNISQKTLPEAPDLREKNVPEATPPSSGQAPGRQWQWGSCPVCLAQQALRLTGCHLPSASVNRSWG